MSPEEQPFSDPEPAVDWSTLTIIPSDDQDGEVIMLADEDAVFEAYGFKAAEEAATAQLDLRSSHPKYPNRDPAGVEDTALPVDDKATAEPIIDWDRDYPDMDVGAIYPLMPEFRLAVRQMQLLGNLSCTLRSQTRQG